MIKAAYPIPSQKGTNGRCSTIVEESNGLTNCLSFLLLKFNVQHYLRKKINKTGRNHLERILEAFRRHLEGMRGLAPLNKN